MVTRDGLCAIHVAAQDAALATQRGTRAQRGYDTEYDRERRAWDRRIQAGERPVCWRCGAPIGPGEDWHLGHTDRDPEGRRRMAGPEHALCNLQAAGRAAH